MTRKFILFGALAGFGVTILLMFLIFMRPFPILLNGCIERGAYYLCPTLLLLFSSSFHNIGSAVAVIMLSNTLLYAIIFGIGGYITSIIKRGTSAP